MMSRFDQKSINIINYYLKDNNWREALPLMSKYIIKHPLDNYMRSIYINWLLKLGKTELAREVFDETIMTDRDVLSTQASYYYAKIKLLLQEGKYEECLNYLYYNENLFHNKNDYLYVEGFCRSKLDENDKGNGYKGYIYQQVLSYNEARALNYIKNNNVITDKNPKGLFDPNFDYKLCYRIIKSKMSEAFKYYTGTIYFESMFKCDNCGTYLRKPTDLVAVNGLLNSDNIIYMFPDNNIHKLDVIDITEEYNHSLKK